jgi:putative spermidine/putrescine transport system substrate-binding protein
LTTTKNTRRVAAAFVMVAMVAILPSACGSDSGPLRSGPTSGSPALRSGSVGSAGSSASTDPLAELVAAAEKEGSLTTIALAHDWCNYGEALTTFTTRYAITLNELNADAGFADQLTAIKAGRDTKDPQAPDVIDVSLTFGARAKTERLLAPYKVSTWDSIPNATKDPNGFWYGGYYGVLAFETNKTGGATPPTDWADLLDASHAHKIALAGDPRVSTQATQTVYAAALANGGTLNNARPGLDFFAKLKKAGNLVATIATPEMIDLGLTPITVRWTYNALAHRDRANGSPDIDVTVPTKGRLAGLYVQAISAYAPHPNAARLWMEFLYSDEGQNIWLKGNCNPIRYDDLSARSAIPADIVANLPDTADAVFPTPDQLNAATTLITQNWNSVVGVDIK